MFSKSDSGKFLSGVISRKHRRLVGWSLIVLGLLFSTPPVIPSPDDFILNLPLAMWLVSQGMPASVALVLTYTLIPIVLVCIGIWVFPAVDGKIAVRVRRLVLGVMHKYVALVVSNPLVLLITAIFIWFVYTFYTRMLLEYGLML